ncbi:MAG: carboxypeptidase-like regulatory domain-containing protein [Terracidiphilus sp.]
MHVINAKHHRYLLLGLFVALLGSGLAVYGQGTSASLTGYVTDPIGAAVPGAKVTITNIDTDFTLAVKTDSVGNYLLRPLPIGNYSLAIEAAGFAHYAQKGIVLTVGLSATQDVHLEIAKGKLETITVVADAELIDTTSAELGTTINEASISALPLDGHDPSSLVFLIPGSVDVQHHGGETIQTGFSFPTETGAGIGSGRNGSTFYMLDGVTNMDNYDGLTAPFPNADATQEFKVLTSNFGAQYGFAPSAVVSIASKSGTNSLHGGAYWDVRNNAMNATDWFSGQTDTLRRNQFGVFAGGPIKKDKLFFFANYQGTKIIYNSTDTKTSTPTTAMLAGDFSGLASAADLASGTTDLNGPFKTINGVPNQFDTALTTAACEYSSSASCNTTVPARLSPAAAYFASQGMVHAATTVSNTTTLKPGLQLANGDMMYTYPNVYDNYNEGTLKLDYNLSPSQTLTLRSYTNTFGSPSSDLPGNMESAYNHTAWTASFWQQMYYFNNLLQHTWTINPTTVNTVSVFMNQMSAHSAAQELGSDGKAMCFSNNSQDPKGVNIGVNEPAGSCYMGALRINSNFGFESGWDEPSAEVRNTLGLTDTLNKIKGKHSFTAGIDLMHQHAVENTAYPTQPMIGFGRNGTAGGVSSLTGISCPAPPAPQVNCSPWGGYLADFMAGYGTGYMQGAGEIADVAGWQIGPFLQDDWKVSPSLTINLGVRWDPNTPPASKNGRGSAWVPGTNTVPGFANSTAGKQSTVYPNAPAGLLFPGDPGVSNTLMNSDYNYWEPRIGMAWQPKFLPRTVIHSGFGIFTGPLQYSEYNHAADVAPFSPTFNFSGWDWDPTCGAAMCPDSVGKGAIIPLDAPWTAPFQDAWGGVSPFTSSPFPGTFAWASTTYKTKPAANTAISKGQQVGQTFARNFKLPTTYAWNFSVEHQVTSTTAIHVAYVGNETEHLSVLIDDNPEWAKKIPVNPNIGDIYEDQSWATASYNSLQVSLDQHAWHGLQVQSSLAWSHTIDITGTSNVSYGNPALGNPISAKWNRGNSGADVPWAWITNLVYQAPSFKEMGKLMEEAVGGWQMSGIMTLQKGSPFSIGQWNSDPGVGMWNDRADLVTGQAVNMGKGSHWDWVNPAKGYFNTAAFVDPFGVVPGHSAPSCNDQTTGWCGFGDTGKNAYFGPDVFGINASIMKNWILMEGKTFQFRWDAFNATNHPNFSGPSSTVNQAAGTFGVISGTNNSPGSSNSSRIFQGALRLTF